MSPFTDTPSWHALLAHRDAHASDTLESLWKDHATDTLYLFNRANLFNGRYEKCDLSFLQFSDS